MVRTSGELIGVEVAYAEPGRQILIPLKLEAGSTVSEAIARSGIAADVPDVSRRQVGIFSRIVGPETPLRDGDRVEIYRRLTIDPKEARRSRAIRRK